MSEISPPVNSGSLAALNNVMGAMELTITLQKRGPHLPNLGCIYGRSGEGKSYATIFVQNKTGAIRVEVGESWNRRSLLKNILRECGVNDPRGTASDMTEQAIMLLGDQPDRPLIVDEADKLVDKGLIEIVRELAEGSQAPVLLVGEENLPNKLQRYERVHNRVLDWFPAQPCDMGDAKKLAKIFLPGIEIDDALLHEVLVKTDARARRIVTTMNKMTEWSRANGVKSLTPATYAGVIFTGEAPKPRGRIAIGKSGRAA